MPRLKWTLDECAKHLKSLPLTEDRRNLSLRVISNVRTAAAARNRCVHDVWFDNADCEAATWVRVEWALKVESLGQRERKPIVGLGELRSTLSRLKRCVVQLDCLMWCVIGTTERWETQLQHPSQGEYAWADLAAEVA